MHPLDREPVFSLMGLYEIKYNPAERSWVSLLPVAMVTEVFQEKINFQNPSRIFRNQILLHRVVFCNVTFCGTFIDF